MKMSPGILRLVEIVIRFRYTYRLHKYGPDDVSSTHLRNVCKFLKATSIHKQKTVTPVQNLHCKGVQFLQYMAVSNLQNEDLLSR